MKVSIIGGGGLVGSCAAFALQTGGIVREIALIDVNAELAAGQALDLLHGASLDGRPGDHAPAATSTFPTSDLICITAGLRRKPDESRLDLINRNVELFLGILGEIKTRRLQEGRDRAGRLATRSTCSPTWRPSGSDLPPAQVIGLGTQLDTIRFRSLIAERLARPADAGLGPDPGRARRQHGADLVERHGRPACRWRSIPAGTPHLADELFTRTKGSGAEVIKKKGGAGFAVGLAIQK